jgi:hypothetical protein
VSDMERRCVADDRCRGYDNARKVPAWTDGLPLCEECLSGAGLDVGRLLLDYRDLANAIPKLSGSGEQVSGTREKPIPLRLDVDALMAEILHVTTTWEEIIRDYSDLGPVAVRVRPGWAVQTAVRILQPRVRQLAVVSGVEVFPRGCEDDLTEVSGSEALLHMVWLHQRARQVLGLTRCVNSLPGECSGCQSTTLVTDRGEETALARPDGSETVYCRSCGRTWTWDEYERYALLCVETLRNDRRSA